MEHLLTKPIEQMTKTEMFDTAMKLLDRADQILLASRARMEAKQKALVDNK